MAHLRHDLIDEFRKTKIARPSGKIFKVKIPTLDFQHLHNVVPKLEHPILVSKCERLGIFCLTRHPVCAQSSDQLRCVLRVHLDHNVHVLRLSRIAPSTARKRAANQEPNPELVQNSNQLGNRCLERDHHFVSPL
jgi:hypothetical protein